MADARRPPTAQLDLPLGPDAPSQDDDLPAADAGASLRTDQLKVAFCRPVSADDGLRLQAQRLGGELRGHLSGRLVLRVHENRSTMVSFRRDEAQIELRVHRIFLEADTQVVRALAEYTRTRSSRSTRAIDRYVRRHGDELATPCDAARVLSAQGQEHDLQALFDELNATYFDGGIDAAIGWGRGTTSARRNSIRMGAYFEDTKTILVHPALDHPQVPPWFVGFVVYHEMLHQAVPAIRGSNGRRQVHPPEFRRRERLYEHFDRARAWERRHLSMLLAPTA